MMRVFAKRDSPDDFDNITARLQELGTGGDAEKLVGQLREYRTSEETGD